MLDVLVESVDTVKEAAVKGEAVVTVVMAEATVTAAVTAEAAVTAAVTVVMAEAAVTAATAVAMAVAVATEPIVLEYSRRSSCGYNTQNARRMQLGLPHLPIGVLFDPH
jgi:hypothetical protein